VGAAEVYEGVIGRHNGTVAVYLAIDTLNQWE